MKEGFPTLPPVEAGAGEKPPVFNPYRKLGEAINNAAHNQALDIMDLAVTEEDLFSKLELVENEYLSKDTDGLSDEDKTKVLAFREQLNGGNISENRTLSVISHENLTDEEKAKLQVMVKEYGRETFIDVVRTSQALVRSEHGEGADVDAGEKPVLGIAGVTKAIEAKIESRNDEIESIKKMIRARGGDDGELQAKIDELESQNEASRSGLERVVEKVRQSELDRNATTRQRVEGRIRKDLSDVDEFEFWGAKYPEVSDDKGTSDDKDKGDGGEPTDDKGGKGPDSGEPTGDDDGEKKDPTAEFSGPVTEILSKLEEKVAEARGKYAKMLSGRKGVSFFSAKFSQKNVTAAQLEYTDVRDSLLDGEFNSLKKSGMSEEDATMLINQVLLLEAGSLIGSQVQETLKYPEGGKLRKLFQKWEEGKLSIVGKAMNLVAPGAVAGLATGVATGLATGRPWLGMGVGAATAVPITGKMGDRVLGGINDTSVKSGRKFPKIDKDGNEVLDDEGKPVMVTEAVRKENLYLRETAKEVERIVRESNELGQDATVDIDDAIYEFAVNRLRQPGVSRTRKAIAAAAISAAAGAGIISGIGALSNDSSPEAPQAEQPSANDVLDSTTTTSELPESTTTEATTTTVEVPEDSDLTTEQQEFIDSLSEEEAVDFVNFINWAVEYQNDNPTLTTDNGTEVEVGTPEYEAEMLLRWNRYFENLNEESNS
jgi:hypothetical protein